MDKDENDAGKGDRGGKGGGGDRGGEEGAGGCGNADDDATGESALSHGARWEAKKDLFQAIFASRSISSLSSGSVLRISVMRRRRSAPVNVSVYSRSMWEMSTWAHRTSRSLSASVARPG